MAKADWSGRKHQQRQFGQEEENVIPGDSGLSAEPGALDPAERILNAVNRSSHRSGAGDLQPVPTALWPGEMCLQPPSHPAAACWHPLPACQNTASSRDKNRGRRGSRKVAGDSCSHSPGRNQTCIFMVRSGNVAAQWCYSGGFPCMVYLLMPCVV